MDRWQPAVRRVLHGVIDEVRVYSRALDADAIRADMARPLGPAEGLMAAYAFDEGEGATARDSSGRGNTGVIRGLYGPRVATGVR